MANLYIWQTIIKHQPPPQQKHSLVQKLHPRKFNSKSPWKVANSQWKRMFFQPPFFRGKLLNFWVYTSYSITSFGKISLSPKWHDRNSNAKHQAVQCLRWSTLPPIVFLAISGSLVQIPYRVLAGKTNMASRKSDIYAIHLHVNLLKKYVQLDIIDILLCEVV